MSRWVMASALLLATSMAACDQAEGGAEDFTTDSGRDALVTLDAWDDDVSTDTMPPSEVACPTSATAMDCTKGTGTGEGDQCHDAPSCYVAMVQKAVNNQVATHPEWFDTSGSCPMILNVNAFLDGVVTEIAAKGYCARRDPNAPDEEITIKKDNAFTENFDVVASTGCARSGAAIYTGFCAPAWW